MTGDAEQVVLSPETSPQGRMPLRRWHRARSDYEITIPTDAMREYGYSIYLLDETPGPRPRPRSPRPLAQ